MPIAPGGVRDAILAYLSSIDGDASLADIRTAVTARLGPVPQSSIRSYLNGNVPKTFTRTDRGRYRMTQKDQTRVSPRG
jgi:hypothetical protein